MLPGIHERLPRKIEKYRTSRAQKKKKSDRNVLKLKEDITFEPATVTPDPTAFPLVFFAFFSFIFELEGFLKRLKPTSIPFSFLFLTTFETVNALVQSADQIFSAIVTHPIHNSEDFLSSLSSRTAVSNFGEGGIVRGTLRLCMILFRICG